MPCGFLGLNGLDIETKIHLLKTYVVLHGLEVITTNKTLAEQLETYQKKLLKQILSVPTNTANPAVYILKGLLPVEAQLDKKGLNSV